MKITWPPIGRPKVYSGSGKEKRKIKVSEVTLIFCARGKDMQSSWSFYTRCRTPPYSGTSKFNFLIYSFVGPPKNFLTSILMTKMLVRKESSNKW